MATTGGLSARIINILDNMPISGATAKLTGPVNQTVLTDDEGKIKLSNLTAGNNYSLVVTADGFEPGIYEDIVVIDDNLTDLNILALQPDED